MSFPLSYPAYYSYSKALLTCNSTINAPLVISTIEYDSPFGAFLAKRLASMGTIKLGGMRPLNMNTIEVVVVKNTRKVVPSLIFGDMELSKLDSTNRIGPTFGAMILSSIKAGRGGHQGF